MSRASSPEKIDQVRERILSAAQECFEQFGYRKTTMAEVADAVGMTAANLYRYFENKQGLVAACAKRVMSERIFLLRKAVAEASGARAKIAAIFFENVRYSHQLSESRPRINELVEEIAIHRKDIAKQRVRILDEMLEEIIQGGVDEGVFKVRDTLGSAQAVRAAMVAFELPTYVGLIPRQAFDQRAAALQRLLCDGLAHGDIGAEG